MFISVKEAADLTGKSATTIYRLCNKRINTDFVRKEDNKFLIDKDFLLATYPQDEPVEIEEIGVATREMRFENVIEVEKTESNDAEKPIVLEKTSPNNKTTITSEGKIETGITVEFENSEEKSYFQMLTTNEVLIGITTSLILIALFIYLLSRLSN